METAGVRRKSRGRATAGASAASGGRRNPHPWRTGGLLVLLKAGIVLALLPFGSTGPFAMDVATLVLASVAALAALSRPAEGSPSWPVGVAVLLAATLAAYVWLQAGPAGLLPAQAIWGQASAALGAVLPASASVAPAATLAAIPAIVVPFLVFAATLRLLDGDEEAISVLRFLAVAGGVIAVFGLVQFGLFPDTLLLSAKSAYRDSLTAVFVNRNSAATYLGCTALLLAALIAIDLRGQGLARTLVSLVLEGERTRRRHRLLAEVFLLAATVLALLLTKSRAGIAASILAALVFTVLLLFRSERHDGTPRSRLHGAWHVGVVLMIVLAASGALLGFFGGQTLLRVQVRGLNDDRFCVLPGIAALAREAWPFGTGAGTFELAFQRFRDPACGIYGVWDRAHQFYLEGVVTLGAAAVLAYGVVYAVLLGVLTRGVLRRRRLRAVPAAGLAILALVTVHDMIDFSLQIPGIAMNTAALLGACCAVALHSPRLAAPAA